MVTLGPWRVKGWGLTTHDIFLFTWGTFALGFAWFQQFSGAGGGGPKSEISSTCIGVVQLSKVLGEGVGGRTKARLFPRTQIHSAQKSVVSQPRFPSPVPTHVIVSSTMWRRNLIFLSWEAASSPHLEKAPIRFGLPTGLGCSIVFFSTKHWNRQDKTNRNFRNACPIIKKSHFLTFFIFNPMVAQVKIVTSLILSDAHNLHPMTF